MFRRRRRREEEALAVQRWIADFNARAKEQDLLEKVAQVHQVILDRGKVPQYYDFVLRKHRTEWPALWNALDELMEEYMKKRRLR